MAGIDNFSFTRLQVFEAEGVLSRQNWKDPLS